MGIGDERGICDLWGEELVNPLHVYPLLCDTLREQIGCYFFTSVCLSLG